ncbi:MAG: carboxymuconolactone decarboxylase family protein [Wenzhouxiangella sp.]|jgi:alkylhydroperoxidase/carboxymuconolactone decarboxylase family protein YurZ|nr:carboxymuconolactone decarboxylase family protein [Wenzhouxiangella sp.]
MSNDIPKTFVRFTDRFPELAEAHRQVGSAVDSAGPLDEKTRALVKLGFCAGAGLQSALKSHVRRGIEKGLTREEIEHAVVLGMNSVGFPATVAAWQWAQNALDEG